MFFELKLKAALQIYVMHAKTEQLFCIRLR